VEKLDSDRDGKGDRNVEWRLGSESKITCRALSAKDNLASLASPYPMRVPHRLAHRGGLLLVAQRSPVSQSEMVGPYESLQLLSLASHEPCRFTLILRLLRKPTVSSTEQRFPHRAVNLAVRVPHYCGRAGAFAPCATRYASTSGRPGEAAPAHCMGLLRLPAAVAVTSTPCDFKTLSMATGS
jgi:hypothetical protein